MNPAIILLRLKYQNKPITFKTCLEVCGVPHLAAQARFIFREESGDIMSREECARKSAFEYYERKLWIREFESPLS